MQPFIFQVRINYKKQIANEKKHIDVLPGTFFTKQL